MKDFTKAEYISPIITEIISNHEIDKSISEYFPGVIAILSNPLSNEGFFLKPVDDYLTNPEFYRLSKHAENLYRSLAEYSEAAETYPGELWTWYNREHERITRTINEALIKAVQEAKTA